MALNLADRQAVRVNIVPRCTQLVVEYALYLLGLGAGATEGQTAWARVAIRSAGAIGDQVSYYALDHPDYIAGGSDITDATLQSVVQTAINTHFIVEPSA